MIIKKVVERMTYHDVVNQIKDIQQVVEYKIFGITVLKNISDSTNEILCKSESVGFKNK